jgi:hypothetical protein
MRWIIDAEVEAGATRHGGALGKPLGREKLIYLNQKKRERRNKS